MLFKEPLFPGWPIEVKACVGNLSKPEHSEADHDIEQDLQAIGLPRCDCLPHLPEEDQREGRDNRQRDRPHLLRQEAEGKHNQMI